MKVFVFDPLWETLVNESHKDSLSGLDITITTDIAPLSTCNELYDEDEDRILCLNPDYVDWKLSSDDYAKIPNLKAIITASTGYGWIDSEHADRNNIAIINIRNFSADSVAEWGVLMMMSLARKLPLLIKDDFPLNFGSDFVTYKGTNIVGKTAGIVGMGDIGQAIAKRLQALGLEVIYWNRSEKDLPYKRVELDELYKRSDFVFPCLSDNTETRTLITETHINSLKPTAIISSIMHNNEHHDTLVEKVTNGNLGGYGFEDPKSNNFKGYKGNIWAAPAYAWCTNETMAKAMDLFVEAIHNAAKGQYVNRVN
jgi:lactate dehydrogenase-like 2-hydroxyacid dehydrogenase